MLVDVDVGKPDDAANVAASAEEAHTAPQARLLEEADIVQVATDLARTQTLYEMTLTTAGKLLSLSLLDFI